MAVVRRLDNVRVQTAQLPLSKSAWSQKQARLEYYLALPNDPYNSYMLSESHIWRARQSPFMHPSCLEAHATPWHESGDPAPCNPTSIRQHPLTPAATPGPPAVPCSEYRHAHETKKGGNLKEGPRRTAEKVPQVIKGGGSDVGALRGQECTNRARSGVEI